MFSNGYVFILLILFKCMSFTKFLLADNSTNTINYKNFNVVSNYSNLTNGSLITERSSTTISMTRLTAAKRDQVKSSSTSTSSSSPIRNTPALGELFAPDIESNEEVPEPRVEPLLSSSKFGSNGKRGRQQDRLQQPPTGLPVFPERSDAVYFIVAVSGGAKTWGRTLARTLLDMGPPFGSPKGPPLRPLYVDLPSNGRFSVNVLTSLCQQTDGVPLAGIVVIGDGQSARAIALSGNAMKVPVLWAKGGTANIHGIQREGQAMFQSLLQPSAREILEAIRALFLQTHWHSFFVLSDVGSTIVLASNEGRPLKESPLVPTILPLPASNGDVFRQLAQISRSTRGIVLLLCGLDSARRIMSEAKSLNMDGGHFIWLWADTSSTTEFFDLHQTPIAFDESVVEYPEAVKQMASSNGDDSTDSGGEDRENFQKHLEDFVDRKIEFEDLDLSRKKSDTWNSDKGRSKPQKHERERQREQQRHQHQQQQPVQTFLREPMGAGRYIFGLNTNSDENNEVKSPKIKRSQYTILNGEANNVLRDIHEQSKSVDTAENLKKDPADYAERPNDSNTDWISDATDSSGSQEPSVDDNDYISPSPFDNSKEVEGETKMKPKRTSNHYGKNITRSSHVLFHHYKDFPVGLLALRPVRMPVDRNFIRSTIRLFASTWAKVDQETFLGDANVHQSRYRSRDYSRYLKGGDQQDQFRSLQRYRRRKSSFMRSRRKRRYTRSSRNNAEIVNTELKLINSSLIRNFNNTKNNYSGALSEDVTRKSSDFNDNLTTNNRSNDTSSYNQNLSGLTHAQTAVVSNHRNENGSNTTTSPRFLVDSYSNSTKSISTSTSKSTKSKRFNTWWSAKETRQQQPTATTSAARENLERYRKGSPHYKGGCYGTASTLDIRKAETFSKALKEATTSALSGRKLFDGSLEKPLTTNFELLNLVPDDSVKKGKLYGSDVSTHGRSHKARLSEAGATKWRHVGSISGTNVQLDTIVWPGGDIVVSGLSVQSKTIFRIVTSLAPPFVMQSELDEDGLCLRGLPCHRLSPSAPHNLTLMFNAIETRDRFEEDAMEHGMKSPPQEETSSYDHSMYMTKCCYGLTMDLLENIAMELNFEFHLYVVHDELFGTRYNSHSAFFRSGDLHFQRKGQAHWSEKHEQHFYKEQSANRQQAPLGGSNYYSASFERKSNLNTNLNLNEEDSKEEVGEYPVEYEAIRQSYTAPSKNPNTKKHAMGEGVRRRLNQERRNVEWNGIIGDLLSGSADMSFAPLSVTRARAEAIDFSVPYFHSGVSLLAAPTTKSEIPLLAFLLPFSPELWIAIFTSLNVTAIAVAIYEWLSPFGLNPWGRQRSKNFSMSSALWVMWGLLCGHLVAFKAPKSWPNKFLINVWGGFSVIFIASYTANIAALIAGLFFHNASNRYDVSLLTQRVGAPSASAAESYVQKNDHHLWEHMKKYTLRNIEDGIRGLKNGSLDLIMGDTPILDYYRATDHGCNLQRIGDNFVEDTYAIGMTKGFPLKDSISALIAKYSSNGYLDILTEKWYGGLPCFKLDNDIVQPRPLGVAAVAGVFLLLGLGIVLGLLILIFEHLFYKYTLPILRHKPKGTVWKSRNIMFFSQKLYRFINCVELVSPHHAARELVHTLRQGQIASLFQKSIKREDEQRRRRKSKAQFFEMIQEIRRVQQQERANPKLEVVTEVEPASGSETHLKPKSSPKPRLFSNRKDSRSRSNSSTLNVRRYSTDSILSERMDTIGRRLSRDLTNSPPDFGRRFETFGKNNKFDTISGVKNLSTEKIEETKFDTYSGKESDKPPLPVKKFHSRRTPLNADTFSSRDAGKSREDLKISPLPALKESLVHPICQEDSSKADLRDQLHEELRSKHSDSRKLVKTASSQTNAESSKSPSRSDSRHRRHKSSDGLEQRPRMPSPRHSNNDASSIQPPALPPKVSVRSNLTQLSLDRLSREDLLKLSESSQSEIHEYLNKTKGGSPNEPP
ncbi:uncharacterized protein LOC119661346 isoform X2 [Hermetia illucens]|uniref:uncharacterized protein LOC119661346 isoform X2 n=1 Tax=Hermetia illucens TaxID=343691 RepID=UPI0018CC08C6|nr:uncharacterized protein LOC119661346 isoform X2 [Hermetia illucens]